MENPLHTPICDLFGIEYPIFLAGMGGVSTSAVTAAVSNAGGLGIIGGATMPVELLRDEIKKTKDLTDKPFAVDLLAPIPDMIRQHMEVVFEEDIRIFVAGLAVPSEFIDEMHKRDMKVVVMCGKVRHAEKSAAAGADVVVVPPAHIDPTARVSQSVIGPHASIGAGARVQQSVVRNSIVGEEAVVESIVLEDSIIGFQAVVTGRPSQLNVGDQSLITS